LISLLGELGIVFRYQLADPGTRFYDRQFITQENVLQGTVERFEKIMNEYFQTDKPQTVGLPSVAYCANELNLSANYFGDLIKKETGTCAFTFLRLHSFQSKGLFFCWLAISISLK